MYLMMLVLATIGLWECRDKVVQIPNNMQSLESSSKVGNMVLNQRDYFLYFFLKNLYVQFHSILIMHNFCSDKEHWFCFWMKFPTLFHFLGLYFTYFGANVLGPKLIEGSTLKNLILCDKKDLPCFLLLHLFINWSVFS